MGGYTSFKTLVINHINNPNASYASTITNVTQDIDVYGDETNETWINKQKTNHNITNLKYHNANAYKLKITSNTNIDEEVEFNGSYTFTTSKQVTIYYKYVNSDNKTILFEGPDYTKD